MLHLPQVLMGELVNFQIDQHIAAEQTVIENKVNIEVFLVVGKSLLTRLKVIAFAQFKQKLLQLVNNCGFKVCFGILRLFFKP